MKLAHLIHFVFSCALTLQKAMSDSHKQAEDYYYLSSINSIRGIFFDRSLYERQSSQGNSNVLKAGAIHVFNGSHIFRLSQYQVDDGSDDSIDLHAVDSETGALQAVLQSISKTIGDDPQQTFFAFDGRISYVQHDVERSHYVHRCALLQGEDWLVNTSSGLNNGIWNFVTHRIERTLSAPYSKIFSDNYGIAENRSGQGKIYERITVELTSGFPIAGSPETSEFIQDLDSRTPAFLIPISIDNLGGAYYIGLYPEMAQYSVSKWRGSGANSYPGTKCNEALDAIHYRSRRPEPSAGSQPNLASRPTSIVIALLLIWDPGWSIQNL